MNMERKNLENLRDLIFKKCCCAGYFFLRCAVVCSCLCVCVEVVSGAFMRLPLPAVAWQGDTAADSS